MVAPVIEKQDTTLRQAIGPAERLAICLRFLATGHSYHTISKSFRVGKSTLVGMVPSVATAIWECLVEEYMAVPWESDWREIFEGFSTKWAFPHCLGVIDGSRMQTLVCLGIRESAGRMQLRKLSASSSFPFSLTMANI